MFSSLNEVFEMQEVHARTNLTAMSEEFSLLEEALLLTFTTIGALNTPHIIAKRRGKSGRIPEIESIQINLAYTTWATIVNACRLLTFGAFADMFNLLRNAQESFSCFWYLRREPSDAGEWLDIQKASKSLVKRGKEDYAQFLRKVSKKFHRETSQKLNYKDQYSLLSTLGTHTNPHSMSLSLPKEGREMHFGFFSAGDDENLRCCAHDVLQLVMSLLEEIYGQFGKHISPSFTYMHKVSGTNRRGHHFDRYIPIELTLPSRYGQLKRKFKTHNAAFTGKLDFWKGPSEIR